MTFSRILSVALFTLSVAGVAGADQPSGKDRVDFVEYRVLSPEGKQIWYYTSFSVGRMRSDRVTTILGFLDSPEIGASLVPTMERRITNIPGTSISLSEGMSMSIATEGHTRSEPLPGGGRRVFIESHLANWWTMNGEAIVDEKGHQDGRLEVRNKAGELVSIYVMKTRRATSEERKTFESRLAAAMKSGVGPGDVVDYNIKRSRVSYPEKLGEAR